MNACRWFPLLPTLLVTAALGTPPALAQEPAQPPAAEQPPRPATADEDTPLRAPEDPLPPDDDAPAPRKQGPQVRARVFGLAGFQSFTASNSFSAVLDTSSGPVFGGGGGMLLGRHLFVDVSVSRFAAEGTRVFVTDGGEVVDLGIATEVTVMPMDVSIGWRFAGPPKLGPSGKPKFRPVPFVGGGFGLQQYKETAEFASSGDDTSESHGSYHAIGGVELPLGRRLGISVDGLYRWVPDAIGTGGVAAYYKDTDLGGAQVRVRLLFTF